MRVCVTFVVFTDCETQTRDLWKRAEYGRTRGTCSVVRRLEVVAVAGLLWISWCFGWGGIIRVFLSFDFFFFFEHARPAASMRPPCLIYLSTSTSGSPTDYDASTKCALDGVPGNVIRLWRLYYMLSLRCSLLWCTRCARSVW